MPRASLEKQCADAYLDTIERLEPDIAMIDAGAAYASIAISLKRIADALEKIAKREESPWRRGTI
jgi:hypothetical protein